MLHDDIGTVWGAHCSTLEFYPDWSAGLDDLCSFSSLDDDDDDEEQLHFFVVAACLIIWLD